MRQENTFDKTKYLLIILRVLSAFIVVSLFIPTLNPAKISDLVNKNLSFFTSGFVYKTAMNGFKRALTKGWVDNSTLHYMFSTSMIACVGFITSGIGGCLTLGEIRLKKLSTLMIFIGNLLGIFGLTGLIFTYKTLMHSTNLKKVAPSVSTGIRVMLPVVIACAVISLLTFLLLKKPAKQDKYEMQPKYYLFLLILPFIIMSFVFAYLPLWGWRYGFYNYKPGRDLNADNFAGFKWFTYLFRNSATKKDIVRVLRNTLAMSGLGLATSWFSMAFAIFLSEIKFTRFRRTVQTLTTIPNFISWVLVYAVGFAFFSTDGFINRILLNSGSINEGINFLLDSSHIWLKMLAWGVWKGLGWGAIIYLAAISGIDQQLYEAATVDGAGRFKRMWYITVPGLLPTYFVLLMLSIAGILSNGMDQYLVFKNSANKDTIEVLDLYVYMLGLGNGGSANIPLATVVGMVKSLVSITLLFFANGFSKLVRKESII
jgi:putative aldouronate transport system permease protein